MHITIEQRPSHSLNSVAHFQTRRRAFTLVELLLVLTILGILAAIVVPKFTGRTEQARITAARTQISTFQTALAAYELDNGFFPKALQDLVVQPRDAQNWKGPICKATFRSIRGRARMFM